MGTNQQHRSAGKTLATEHGGSGPMQGLDPVVPDEIASLFEQPSLLPGEDPQAYSWLLTAVGRRGGSEGRDRMASGQGRRRPPVGVAAAPPDSSGPAYCEPSACS